MVTDVAVYNLNSDASYIPQYAGTEGKNNLQNTIKYANEKIHSFELLGWSNDIDNIIEAAKSGKDAEYAISVMSHRSLAKTYSNPPIYTGCDGIDTGSSYVWKFDIADQFNTDQRLSSAYIALYKDIGDGRNPFYYGKIADIISASSAGKCITVSNMLSGEAEEGIVVDNDIADIRIAGTYDCFTDRANDMSECYIENIRSI